MNTCNMDRVEMIIIKGSIQLMFENGKSPSGQHATDEARQTPTGLKGTIRLTIFFYKNKVYKNV